MPDPSDAATQATSPTSIGRFTMLRRGMRTIAAIRWAAIPFAALQVATYYIPYPPGVLPAAIGVVVALAAAAAVLSSALQSAHTPRALRRLGYISLGVDTTVAVAFVAIFTFDPDTATWALLYILPLEGALLFQLRGALWSMGAATLLYILREVYGALAFDIPFLVVSITFRMGIGFIIASAAGLMARGMLTERDRVDASRAHLERRTAQLRQSNERLEAARALQDDFLAMTNHELRTPLTAILGYAATLERRWDAMPDPARRKALNQITLQSERLLELVDDVLTASAAQAGRLHVDPRPTPLRPILEAAVAASEVEAAVHCDPDLTVRADPRRLGQALENLLTNARKYGRDPITLDAGTRGEEVLIAVQDSGTGVPPEFVPRLFQRFTRAPTGTGEDAGGNGLGLAIVKGLAEAHGGRVWYEAADDGGARFCLTVPPAVIEAEQPRGEAENPTTGPSGIV